MSSLPSRSDESGTPVTYVCPVCGRRDDSPNECPGLDAATRHPWERMARPAALDDEGRRMSERMFTAAEVQEAIEAVILYERARREHALHLASASIRALLAESRREVRRDRHQTIDEMRASLARQEA